MNTLLLLTLLLTQTALWVGYSYQLQGTTLSKFWGNVPEGMWGYLLGAAALAYAMNLFLVAKLSFHDLNPSLAYWAAGATLMYYVLQMFFLPLVEQAVGNGGSRWPVRILLLVCILPIAALAGIGIGEGFVISSVFPLLHVIVNDALLYGFLF